MLSVQSTTDDAGWRGPLLKLIDGETDIDNDAAVYRIFDEGIRWRDSMRIADKDRSREHPAHQYLRTRNLRTGPIIPRFMRAFIAHKLKGKLACVEAGPLYGMNQIDAPAKVLPCAVSKAPQKPAPQPRMGVSGARSFA